MNREKQLLKNTGILALGKICTQFVSFFLLPLYTSFLSTKEYGTVDLLNNYIALLIPIFFFQMDQAVFRFLIDVRNDEKKRNEIISTVFITILTQLCVFIILYLIFSFLVENNYKYFLLTNVIAAMISGLLLQICRGLGDNASYSLGSLISGISTIILNIVFIVAFKMGAVGMLTATFIANVLCILFIFFRKKIYRMFSFKLYSKTKRSELLKYSIPLIPNQLSWWIVNVSDRTIISQAINVGANGIYSAANKFSTICITFFNFFNMTWSESASMHIKDGDSDVFFTKILNTSVKLFSLFCFLIVAVMPFLFKYIITGSGYADAYYQIPILMVATIFNIITALFGSIYVALKKSNEIAKTSMIAAAINIFLNIIFIKKIGLYAASISTVIAYLTMTIYRYNDVQKYVKIKFEIKSLFFLFVIGSIVILTYYIRNNLLCFISLIFVIAFSVIMNIEILKQSIIYIKNKFTHSECVK